MLIRSILNITTLAPPTNADRYHIPPFRMVISRIRHAGWNFVVGISYDVHRQDQQHICYMIYMLCPGRGAAGKQGGMKGEGKGG